MGHGLTQAKSPRWRRGPPPKEIAAGGPQPRPRARQTHTHTHNRRSTMTEKPNLRAVQPKVVIPDAEDFDALWIDPTLGDGIVSASFSSVPVDKPKTFFRTHPDPTFRRRTEIYTHKPEGQIEEQHF